MNEKPNMKDIIDNFWEGITFYIDKIFKTAPFDKTDTAIIKGISEFGYIIDYNRKMYYDVRTIGGTCSINETVKIMIPQNNMSNVFILKGADITTLEENFIEKNKITMSGTVNQPGYVADAREINPSINNTLAWNIEQIKNSINTVTQGTITNIISNSQYDCRVYKNGKIVTLYLLINPNVSLSFNTSLFTISDGYRPISQLSFGCRYGNPYSAVVRINSAGVVSILSATTTLAPNNLIEGAISYIIN